jgi:hypothetical protein
VEARSKLDDNLGIVKIKDLMIKHLLPAAFDFEETKRTLAHLHKRIIELERNYENVFLVASGETLKNLSDYSALRNAVEDIIATRE